MSLPAGIRIKERTIKSFDGLDLWTRTIQAVPDWQVKNTVVFVHGLANAAEVWEAVIDNLIKCAPRTRFIVYDLRGHGRSTKKFSHLSETRLELIHAFDLKTVLEKMAPWRPILVGHSMGGIIIQEYLNLEPWLWQRPREVFLLATNTETRKIKGLDRRKIMENFAKLNKYEQKPASGMDLEEYLKTKERGDFNWKKMLATATRLPLEGSLLHWLGIMNWENSYPELINRKNITLIYGTKDKLFPVAATEAMLAKNTRMKRVRLEADHGLNISKADEVAAEICKVLKK